MLTRRTDYKKSKNSDVIGTLISIFDTKDIFVKEFQNIMGERLLRKDFDYDKEVRNFINDCHHVVLIPCP